MKRFLNLIVATDVNGCIGNKGPHRLMFYQKSDMKRFRAITTGQVVIMGKNTFDSLGKSLPNRTNIVISKNHTAELREHNDVIAVTSLEEAIELGNLVFSEKQMFLIGGASLYNEAIQKDYVETFFITILKTSLDGDAIVNFPDFTNDNRWETWLAEAYEADEENQFKYVFMNIGRK